VEIDRSALHLKCLISAYMNAAAALDPSRPVKVDLIGYSLGGVVALRYLANDGFGVAHVVTLSSPLNGTGSDTVAWWNARLNDCAPLSCPRTALDRILAEFGKTVAEIIVGPPGAGQSTGRLGWQEEARRTIAMSESVAVAELRRLGLNLTLGRDKTRTTIQELQARGVKIWAYANEHDPVVMAADATVAEFTRTFKRGTPLGKLEQNLREGGDVFAWLQDAQNNHSLITRVRDKDEEATRLRLQLCADLEIRCAP
jgi:pimeloyl-ACP methyl ester carboxylesterase